MRGILNWHGRAWKSHPVRVMFGWGATAFLALVILGGIISPAPEPAGSATAATTTADQAEAEAQTPAPTPAPTPVPTPAPTAAPTPVPTPAPTVKPVATPAPTPNAATTSAIERAQAYDYLLKAKPLTERYSAQLQAVSALSKNPQPLNPTWTKDYLAAWTTIQQLGVEARTLTPPPCLSAFHTVFLEGITSLDLAAAAAITGVTTVSADQLTVSIAHMNAGTAAIVRSVPLLKNAPCLQ
jgi:hypothetical protein